MTLSVQATNAYQWLHHPPRTPVVLRKCFGEGIDWPTQISKIHSQIKPLIYQTWPHEISVRVPSGCSVTVAGKSSFNLNISHFSAHISFGIPSILRAIFLGSHVWGHRKQWKCTHHSIFQSIWWLPWSPGEGLCFRKTTAFGTLLEGESRARFSHNKKSQNLGLRLARNRPHCQLCAHVWPMQLEVTKRICMQESVMLPLSCRDCKRRRGGPVKK